LALLNRVIEVMVGRMSPHPKRLPLGTGLATRLAGTVPEREAATKLRAMT
jgi:hypothetical protein